MQMKSLRILGNHWGTSTLINKIKKIAETFESYYPGTKVRINDMSLEYGGLFDVDNNWTTSKGHKSHRTGVNADVGFKVIAPDNSCVDFNNRRLRRIIQLVIDREPIKHSNHFHISVN